MALCFFRQDAFQQTQFGRSEIEYEEAAILYGLRAAYSLLGQKESRANVDVCSFVSIIQV